MSTLRDNIKEKKSPFPKEILHPPLADQNDKGIVPLLFYNFSV